jgi:hypothetical protein
VLFQVLGSEFSIRIRLAGRKPPYGYGITRLAGCSPDRIVEENSNEFSPMLRVLR